MMERDSKNKSIKDIKSMLTDYNVQQKLQQLRSMKTNQNMDMA